MIRQDLHPLKHLVVLEVLSETSYVLFKVTDSRNKHISEPERTGVFFKPPSCLQRLDVASSCEIFVPFRIHLLYIEKHQVCECEKFLHRRVPYASVCIKAYMDAFFLEPFHQRYQLFCLNGGLSSREGHSSASAEEWLLVHSHIYYMLGFCLSPAVKCNCIRIGTVQTAERTAL